MTSDHPSAARRSLLKGLSLAPAAGLAAGAGAGALIPAAVRAAPAEANLIPANYCLLTPEVTEGPYYIDPGLVRADITEDRAGVPMELVLQVVDAGCVPLREARVDVWHCDAVGNYSGYSGQGSDTTVDTAGETFLRGTQFTGPDGAARFTTIYPGWYRGRTTHVHFKVFLDEVTVLTSQLFFPDALSEYIFGHVAAYAGRTMERDTVNSSDGIAREAGDAAFASIREQSDRYVASLVVGVRPDVVSVVGTRPAQPAPPPPGPGQPGGPRSLFGPDRDAAGRPLPFVPGER